MVFFKITPFHESCRTLYRLSKMILANVISLLLWRYCTISFLSKSLCLQITAAVSKITKSVSSDLTFIFIKSFVKVRLVVKINSIASFIKTRFYWERDCIKCANMQKCSVLIRANNWQLSLLHQLRRFQNRNSWYNFQTLFGMGIAANSFILT